MFPMRRKFSTFEHAGKKLYIISGHTIETDVIERRYKAGIKNLFKLYCDKVDSLLIYDNSTLESELIAEKEIENAFFTIHNSQKFNSLKMNTNEQ